MGLPAAVCMCVYMHIGMEFHGFLLWLIRLLCSPRSAPQSNLVFFFKSFIQYSLLS